MSEQTKTEQPTITQNELIGVAMLTTAFMIVAIMIWLSTRETAVSEPIHLKYYGLPAMIAPISNECGNNSRYIARMPDNRSLLTMKSANPCADLGRSIYAGIPFHDLAYGQ
jgi:hypothetical protein